MCVFSQESWLKKSLTASKSVGARYGPCMQSWPFIIHLALEEKERVVLQELQVGQWEPPFVGQGDLPGLETPSGFSEATVSGPALSSVGFGQG